MAHSFALFTAARTRAGRLAGAVTSAWQRFAIAMALALSLAGGLGMTPQPAYAYNCVNVVLRDPYWGRYRGIVESGWNAAGVGGAFARSGWVVNGTPEAGAIMVWPPNFFGASSTGHVGIVAAVYDNGTVLVRHENWPYGTAEHPQVFAVRPGHQFVHLPGAAVPVVAADSSDEDGA